MSFGLKDDAAVMMDETSSSTSILMWSRVEGETWMGLCSEMTALADASET
jgi:hypothetical protein